MSNNPLQQAVVNAAIEFAAAREKLTRAEHEYNKTLQNKPSTWNAVDTTKEHKFSNSAPLVTDC